jgi:hypothetical protein
MKSVSARSFAVAAVLLAGATCVLAQDAPADTAKPPKPYEKPPLFADEAPIDVTLTAPFRQLRRNRTGAAVYKVGTLAYAADTGVVAVPARVRPRGVWRRQNCDIPPLLLNLSKDSTRNTLFAKLDRVRLTLHCRDQDDYDQYLLKEYQLYRVQRLLTPYTFDVRLARMTYVDSERRDTVARRYGFFQEQDDLFAHKVGAKLMEVQGAGPADIEPYQSAFFGVFQYFVGNSDFSIRALHNVVLLYKEPVYVPAARDFDWSGAVNARYAKPNPILPIKTITQRIMRGYCAPAEEYEKVFALFRAKKDSIYALYRDSIGSLMKPNVVKETLEYFDDFYEIIDDPRRAKRDIVEACLGGSA